MKSSDEVKAVAFSGPHLGMEIAGCQGLVMILAGQSLGVAHGKEMVADLTA